MTHKIYPAVYLALLAAFCEGVFANTEAEVVSDYDKCLLHEAHTVDQATSLESVREYCLAKINTVKQEDASVEELQNMGALSSRIYNERMQQFDPYVITPHRMNYVLPVYTTSGINKQPYEEIGEAEYLKDVEAKFQLSLKIPLNTEDLFVEGDGLYFGFTVESWWQVYAGDISRPFRETNYQPEIFYAKPIKWTPFDGFAGLVFGIEHQSNGRTEQFSRSWNRVYTTLAFEKGNFAMTLRPWWRIPESEDEYPGDPRGDDNPDIDDYMGHFEINTAYRWDRFELNFMGRQNFDTSRGAVEAGFIFPLWGRVRGYTSVFSGYGDSLIDYDYSQTRFGLGIALTGFL